MRKKLLIIIDTLQKGGAEVLLVGILPELNKAYEVILVTLSGESDFEGDKIICAHRYVLGFHGKISFVSCIMKLRNIIKKHQPDIVHSHLFYSSLAARLACPSHIPLLYSVHNELSKNIFNHSKLLTFVEKQTVRRNHSIIGVSKLVLDDYTKTIGTTRKTFVLKNYVADNYFSEPGAVRQFNQIEQLKMIAVGNLKDSKNYEYLLQSMIAVKNYPVTLDIYGNSKNHPLYPKMQSIIDVNQLQVTFKGPANNIREIFRNYDVYIMSSKYEGFGIAAVEAMSQGLPALLADLPVLREVTYDEALFFDINDPDALPGLIKEIFAGKHDLNILSKNGMGIAAHYTRQNYLQQLLAIYNEVLTG